MSLYVDELPGAREEYCKLKAGLTAVIDDIAAFLQVSSTLPLDQGPPPPTCAMATGPAPPALQEDSNAYLEAKQLLINRIASERAVAPHVRRRCFRSLLGRPGSGGAAAQQLSLLLCEKRPAEVRVQHPAARQLAGLQVTLAGSPAAGRTGADAEQQHDQGLLRRWVPSTGDATSAMQGQLLVLPHSKAS
jgi:hypothetical protein